MKNKINNSKKHFALGVATIALLLTITPLVSSAATYAFINKSGDLATVVANDPYTAIATAVNRAVTSGVILLMSAADYVDLGI